MKVKFKYYLHDDSSGSERTSLILDQLPPAVAEQYSEEEFSELIGRPFYEIELDCELDLSTGSVTILSAKR